MLNLPPRLASRLNSSQFANLYTFLIVARHLSFARAADELCLTASAVSHRIHRLEQALTLPLFLRLNRRIRLTQEGEHIFDILENTVDELSNALQDSAQAPLSGAVVLYSHPSIAQCWLAPRLHHFAKRYPTLTVDLRVGHGNADFRANHIDLALYYADGQFPGLTSHPLMGETLTPVCSPSYAQQHDLYDKPENLQYTTLLHDSRAWNNGAFDAEWTMWAQCQGVTTPLPKPGYTFDRSDLCCIAALHHLGIAIGRQRLVQDYIDRGELVTPFGGFSPSTHYGYYLVHPLRDVLPNRVQALKDWLLEYAST